MGSHVLSFSVVKVCLSNYQRFIYIYMRYIPGRRGERILPIDLLYVVEGSQEEKEQGLWKSSPSVYSPK